MRAVILSCPHLQRDISGIQERVPGVEVMLGVKTPRGEDGCLEMHKAVVRSAKANGDPAVFVMEDDCQFTPAFDYQRWVDDAKWAELHGYDVLAGGCIRTYEPHQVRNGLIACKAFRSAHCLVYFASGYDKVQAAVQPYDFSLGNQCGISAVVALPFVAVQRPSFSGILRKPVNYVPEYTKHQAQLQKMFTEARA